MMRETLIVRARAKINLYLDVLGRLPSGYHAIETLMQSIDLADTLRVRVRREGIVIECDDPDVPSGEENLIVRAAMQFLRFAGIRGGVHVVLEKRIPMGGGLGGGSADAAATLVALNRLYGTHFPAETLERLGGALGADVPFCVRGGTAWATGIGTTLSRLPGLGPAPVLLVNPGIVVNTAWAYRALALPPLARGAGQLRLTGWAAGVKIAEGWKLALSRDLPVIGDASTFRNRFESVVFPAHPALKRIRDALRERGAIALMSGSGGTVFGVFRRQADRDAALAEMKPMDGLVVGTRFADRGVELIA